MFENDIQKHCSKTRRECNKQQKIDIQLNSQQSQLHKFIINADDYGISEPRSQGILQLIKANKVTSISVLVNGVNGDSVEKWSRQLKEYIFDDQQGSSNEKLNHQNQHLLKKVSVGLHFNLTEGNPLCRTIPCALVNPQTKSLMGKTYIYQYLGEGNRRTQLFPLAMEQFIKTQLRLQIQKFIELFSFRPSHIDGHNHVHVIPQVAELIAPVMRQIGIYKTRLPLELIQSPNDNPKNVLFASNAQLSKPVFSKYGLIFPTIFVGCQEINRLNWQNIQTKIKKRIHAKQNQDNGFIELMCHPGYTDLQNGDEFNRSKGRQAELHSLKSKQFEQIIQNSPLFKLSNFNQLSPSFTQNSKPRILLYSKMSRGCGNWTTSLRLQHIFQGLGYEVYLRSIEENINTQFQIESLRQFLIHFRITLIIGVNLTRSGRVIYHATRSQNELTNRVPYIFIVAGTDANIYFNMPQAVSVLKQPLQNCQLIIALSDSMRKLTESFLRQKLEFEPNKKSVILLSQSSNILVFQKPEGQARQNVHRCLKQNYNLEIRKDRYIVFPASFRPVKDIEFLLKHFNQLIQQQIKNKNNLRVLILGPVLDKAYYEKCFPSLGKVQYWGSLQKELYVQVLKNAFFLVNSSISQGQCCSIQQAQEIGQVCVVRDNEGNAELIKHDQTGFLFSTPQQFMNIYRNLSKDQNKLLDRIKKNALEYHRQNFSVQAQAKNYKVILDKIVPLKSKLFTYSDVHSVSQINLGLYRQVPQQLLLKWFENTHGQKRLIDIGCGSGIFGMTILQKFPKEMQCQMRLQLYDYNASVISNCYYNCLQQINKKLCDVKSIRLQVSDMFQAVQNPHTGNLFVANMPQTPFQKESSRPDKNGGIDSLKFNEDLIRKFSSFSSRSVLVMLYSYMSNPNQFFKLMDQLDLKVIWRSQRTSFKISARAYDEMEQNVSKFLKTQISEGRAQVQIVEQKGEETFIVPAQILVIQKQKE